MRVLVVALLLAISYAQTESEVLLAGKTSAAAASSAGATAAEAGSSGLQCPAPPPPLNEGNVPAKCFREYAKEVYPPNCIGFYNGVQLKNAGYELNDTAVPGKMFFHADLYTSFVNGEHPPKDAEKGVSITTIPNQYYRDIEVLVACKPELLEGMLAEGRKVFDEQDWEDKPKMSPQVQCFHYPNGVPAKKPCQQANDGCASVPYIHLHTFARPANTGYQVDWNMPGDAYDVTATAAKEINWCKARTDAYKTDDTKQAYWKTDCPGADQYPAGICVSTEAAPPAAAKQIIELLGGNPDAAGAQKVAGAQLSDLSLPPKEAIIIASTFLLLLMAGFYKLRKPTNTEYLPLLEDEV